MSSSVAVLLSPYLKHLNVGVVDGARNLARFCSQSKKLRCICRMCP